MKTAYEACGLPDQAAYDAWVAEGAVHCDQPYPRKPWHLHAGEFEIMGSNGPMLVSFEAAQARYGAVIAEAERREAQRAKGRGRRVKRKALA